MSTPLGAVRISKPQLSSSPQPLSVFLILVYSSSTTQGFDYHTPPVQDPITNVRCYTDQDAQKEERQKGYPVLFDGVWCLWDRYVDERARTTQQRGTTIDLDLSGRTTFVNTLCGKKVLAGLDADDASNAHVEENVKIKPVTVGTNLSWDTVCPNGS